MNRSVLIIDDDELLCRSLTLALEQAGFHARNAASGEAGLALARAQRPDLVLLDIGLPGMDGLDTMRHLRELHVPVIFLTARRRQLDELIGLELGADDYVTKPFGTDVLIARMRAVLRRVTEVRVPVGALQVGDLHLDAETRAVRVDQRKVELSNKEFELLFYLAQRPGVVVSVDEIVDSVWGEAWSGARQTVYVHMRWLRTKLESDPAHPTRLVTVRGVGYKLMAVPA